MNIFLKSWRKFNLVVAKRRQSIGVENKFQIGDWVVVREPLDMRQQRSIPQHSEVGEVVDVFYGFDMNAGWRWHYQVQYKRKDTVIVLYEEQEICIDAAWIRAKRLKKLGI